MSPCSYDRRPVLNLNRKGVADEELSKKEAQRAANVALGEAPSRSVSASSYSSVSASTISTRLSRSISPGARHHAIHRRDRDHWNRRCQPMSGKSQRRRASTSSDMSISDRSEDGASGVQRQYQKEPYSKWPERLDRRRANDKKRRRSASSLSSNDGARDDQRALYMRDDDRNLRRRHSSTSPDDRGRDRYVARNYSSRRERSRSSSRDKSMIARHRSSMTLEIDATPGRKKKGGNGSDLQDGIATRPGASQNPKEPSSSKDQAFSLSSKYEQANRRHQDARERSLSPYSKRLALTQSLATAR